MSRLSTKRKRVTIMINEVKLENRSVLKLRNKSALLKNNLHIMQHSQGKLCIHF